MRNLFTGKNIMSIASLTIALSVCLILFGFVWHERNYDRHFDDGTRMYRMITKHGEGDFVASTFPIAGDAYTNAPEVEDYTFFISPTNAIVEINDQSHTVKEFVIADHRFIDFFSIKMHYGKKEMLKEPNTVFITPEAKQKMFPFEDPIGKTILFRKFEGNAIDTLGHFTVRGIVENLPVQSHFGFDMIFSQVGNFDWLMNHIKGSKSFGGKVYLKLNENANKNKLEASFSQLLEPFLGAKHGPPLKDFSMNLQPVHQIHFNTGLNGESRPTVSITHLRILMTIGLFIFLLAMANYSNLFLSKIIAARHRTGVLKSIGGNLSQLLAFSLWQVLPGLLISLILSLLLVVVIIPLIPQLLTVNLLSWNNLIIMILVGIGLIALLLCTVTLLAYLRIKHDHLINTFSSRLTGNWWKGSGNNLLVTFQFAVVIFLLSFSILIFKQIDFIQKKDLGFTPSNVAIYNIPSFMPNGKVICDEISTIPGIISVSTAHHYPGSQMLNTTLKTGGHEFPFNYGIIEPGTLDVLNIDFHQQMDGELKDGGWVINKTFYNNLIEVFGKNKVLNNDFSFETDDTNAARLEFRIQGVTADFHYHSLYDPLQNFAFLLRHPETGYNRYLMIRMEQPQIEKTIKEINSQMDTFFPGIPPQYTFLDETLNQQYQSDTKLSNFVSWLSVVAIVIASFGLFGLSVSTAQKRIKEIGVRKINGAKVIDLIYLLNIQYIKWILIAFLFSMVVSGLLMNRWLENFAYKTELSWWIFAFAGVLALGIALLTVSWQSYKAATRNPVEALRYE